MISAQIIADTTYQGDRITTFVLRYPRFIHAEFLTHRVFSRNSSSSRAIPVIRTLNMEVEDIAYPCFWGKEKKGMSADEEVAKPFEAMEIWCRAYKKTKKFVAKLAKRKVHKQLANRLLEPWSHIDTIVTSTTFSNFFRLRISPHAQPEIMELARKMARQYLLSVPCDSPVHVPFMSDEDRRLLHSKMMSQEDISKESVKNMLTSALPYIGKCARVSYSRHTEDRYDLEDNRRLAVRLMKNRHMSPFEHVAIHRDLMKRLLPDEEFDEANFKGWIQSRKILIDDDSDRELTQEELARLLDESAGILSGNL